MVRTSYYRGSLQAKIWRYSSFTKFVAMLDHGGLFFSRIDLLDDPFEGSLPAIYSESEPIRLQEALERYLQSEELKSAMPELLKDSEARDTDGRSAAEEHVTDTIDQRAVKPSEISTDAFAAGWEAGRQFLRKLVVVNCWCQNEYESAALWKVFSADNHGIAVQSTVRKLVTSLNDYSDRSIVIGDVQYIDYKTDDVLPEGVDPYRLYLLKRKSFEYERELRALIYNRESEQEVQTDPVRGVEPISPGLQVPADLDVLIERIYVHPSSPRWFQDLVADVLNKYGLKKEVIRSDLAASPIY